MSSDNMESDKPNGFQHNEALCKLFVGNVNKSTTDEDFKRYFDDFGLMKSITLVKDPNNPLHNRGFGFVNPEMVEVTDKILLHPNHQLDGRELDIKRALPKEIDDALLHTRTPRIFLGGLPHNISEEEITTFFNDKYSDMGMVKEVVIKRERQTGRPRGFCFVSFDNPHVVDKMLIEMRFPTINNKRCEIKKADAGIPITGAPPSQIQKHVGGGRSQGYSQSRGYHHRSYPNGSHSMTPNPPYDYSSAYSGSSAMGYPQSNAYYGYYQNQGAHSHYHSQAPQGYASYPYPDQRSSRSSYQRPMNNYHSRGRPY